MNLYDILFRWNLWGNWTPNSGFSRHILDKIALFLHEPEIIALIGPRRSGKSTVMYQLMERLQMEGIPTSAILHINFEEPSLSPLLGCELLDNLYNTFRSQIYPTGRAYIFLDEIQNVPEWERWVRARNESDNIKIIITGSSSHLMSRELATLLTGRNITFDIYPLSFRELLAFKNIPLPNQPYPENAPADIQYALHDYVQWGGFPRVALNQNTALNQTLLQRYFEDLLYKDVIMRHRIRDVNTLRNIAIYLLTNTATLVSYRRLSDVFQASPELVQSYCNYLHEAFLVDFLPFYTMKAGEKIRNPNKVHALDLGLRHAVSLGTTPDHGKLIETLVYQTVLRKETDGIFYWKDDVEIDFVIRRGIDIHQLIQVAYSGLDNEKIRQREINALITAGKLFPHAKKTLVIAEMPKSDLESLPADIELIPLWQFLLLEI